VVGVSLTWLFGDRERHFRPEPKDGAGVGVFDDGEWWVGNFATARLWDDGILDPAQTRMALGLAFSATLNVGLGNGRYGIFRV
jgi:hypothetical protein